MIRRTALSAMGSGERGIAVIWTALTLVIMVAAAGMTVDVGNWKVQESRQQNAADSASLGGVVFLPDDFSTASDIAVAVASQHGYDLGEVSVSPGPQANQLRVTVQRTVETAFLSVIGVNDKVITQTALAEFEAPVSMGSPDPTAGNDPESSPPNQPQYWLTAAAPGEPKINGDRYGTQPCGGATFNCTGDTNDDYDPNGYFFSVSVSPSAAGSPLGIQVFDGAMFAVGDTCGSNLFPSDEELTLLTLLTDAADLAPGLVADWYDDATDRYQSDESIWCTGDRGSDTVRPSFVFRAPDETPWNNLDNEIVASCPAVTMPGFNGQRRAFDYLFPEGTELPVDPSAPSGPGGPLSPPGQSGYFEPHPETHGQHIVDPDDGVITFAESWRRWYTMCEIPTGSVVAGEYLVQMVTGGDTGHNRLSLRAGRVTSGAFSGTGVTVEARGRLPISALGTDSNTTFSIARVLPGGQNRELEIELYDMGDAENAGTLRVLPPTDSTMTGFGDCSFERSDGAVLAGASPSTCTLTGVSRSAGFNGRAIIAKVPIPDSYDCDEGSATGCWVRVQAVFSGGVTDTTTWSATMNGDPVRLIE